KNALAALRKVVTDPKADPAARQAAITALVDARDPELVPVLQALVSDPALRGPAIRGLAAFDDPKTPEVILAAYPNLTPAEKKDAVATLASRATYAKALMAAVGAKKVPVADISGETVRQLRNLQDKELDKLIVQHWGTVRDTPEERKKLIAEWRGKIMAPNPPPAGNRRRAGFAKTRPHGHTLHRLRCGGAPCPTGR